MLRSQMSEILYLNKNIGHKKVTNKQMFVLNPLWYQSNVFPGGITNIRIHGSSNPYNRGVFRNLLEADGSLKVLM